jgi:hypothetical protein
MILCVAQKREAGFSFDNLDISARLTLPEELFSAAYLQAGEN